MAPYFVFLGKNTNNHWSTYYIAVLISFTFGVLQGVQDKIDDPFDGMSEDDINVKTIDEWTFNSLEVTVNRDFKVGRFQVTPKHFATRDEKTQYSSKISQQKFQDAKRLLAKLFEVTFEDMVFRKRMKMFHYQRKNVSKEEGNPVLKREIIDIKVTLQFSCHKY